MSHRSRGDINGVDRLIHRGRVMEDKNSRILVIRFSSLGDLILLLPFLVTLRNGFRGGEISFATKERYRELFEQNRDIDRLYLLRQGGPHELLRLYTALRHNRFDIIIDAHNVIRSNVLFHLLRAPSKLQISKDQAKKLLLIRGKHNLFGSGPSQLERYLEMAGRLGIKPVDTDRLLDLPEAVLRKAETALRLPCLAGKNLVAVAPGARWETKRWPESHFARLISSLSRTGFAPVLIGGKEDIELNRRIAADSAVAPPNLTGELSILETAAVLGRCRILVTNDSAPLHLSESVGTPVVAFFGPTVKEFGYYPRLKNSVAVEIDLPCRPCSRNGARPCPIGTKECLAAIRPEQVSGIVEDIVRGGVPAEHRAGPER